MIRKNPDLAAAMYGAVSESIENMAFMEVIHGTVPPAGDLAWVSLTIDDPIRDRLFLGMPLPLLRRLTSSVFGLDEEELSEQMLRDSLAELLNTIGGVFCTRVLPHSQTYQLGLPVQGRGPFPKQPDCGCYWLMQLEDESLIVAADGDGLQAL